MRIKQNVAMNMELTFIERLARMASVNCKLAGPGDDGIDSWYGDQYLPNGSLARFANLLAEECAKLADQAVASAMLEHPEKRLVSLAVGKAIRTRFPPRSVGSE